MRTLWLLRHNYEMFLRELLKKNSKKFSALNSQIVFQFSLIACFSSVFLLTTIETFTAHAVDEKVSSKKFNSNDKIWTKNLQNIVKLLSEQIKLLEEEDERKFLGVFSFSAVASFKKIDGKMWVMVKMERINW